MQQHNTVGVFTIDNIFSQDQIENWRNMIHNSPDDVKKFNNNGNFKNGKIIDPTTSNVIWEAIRPHLPRSYRDTKNQEWSLIGPSRYVMYASILPGQSFPIHTDTGAEYGPEGESKFTVLVYLDEDFIGGHTTFYDYEFQKTVDIVPKMGRTLMFDIDLYHAGEAVISGKKNWIGTEVVCDKLVFG